MGHDPEQGTWLSARLYAQDAECLVLILRLAGPVALALAAVYAAQISDLAGDGFCRGVESSCVAAALAGLFEGHTERFYHAGNGSRVAIHVM